MPVETGMYGRMQAADIEGGVQRGLKMRNLMDERAARQAQAKEQATMKDLYAQHTGEDGQLSAEGQTQLARINPKEAMAYKKDSLGLQSAEMQNQSAKLQQNRDKLGLIGQTLGPARDNASWKAGVQKLTDMGLDTSDISPIYDPNHQKAVVGRALTYAQQLDQQLAQQKMGQAQSNSDRDFGLKQRELGMKQEEAQNKASMPALSEAEKAADREYGKEFVRYTGKGRSNAVRAIEKLKQLQQEVEKDTGFGEAGGTRLPIPDMFRSRLAIERRDDAMNFANTTLKELFGGQLSDDERKAAAREYWNDALDNESNAKRLATKIEDLERNLRAQDEQAKWYQDNKTLAGFKFDDSVGVQGPSAKDLAMKELERRRAEKEKQETIVRRNRGPHGF